MLSSSPKWEQLQKMLPDKDIVRQKSLLINKTFKPMAINTHPKENGPSPNRKGQVTKTGPPASKRLGRILAVSREKEVKSGHSASMPRDTVTRSRSHSGLDEATWQLPCLHVLCKG